MRQENALKHLVLVRLFERYGKVDEKSRIEAADTMRVAFVNDHYEVACRVDGVEVCRRPPFSKLPFYTPCDIASASAVERSSEREELERWIREYLDQILKDHIIAGGSRPSCETRWWPIHVTSVIGWLALVFYCNTGNVRYALFGLLPLLVAEFYERHVDLSLVLFFVATAALLPGCTITLLGIILLLRFMLIPMVKSTRWLTAGAVILTIIVRLPTLESIRVTISASLFGALLIPLAAICVWNVFSNSRNYSVFVLAVLAIGLGMDGYLRECLGVGITALACSVVAPTFTRRFSRE